MYITINMITFFKLTEYKIKSESRNPIRDSFCETTTIEDRM